MNNTDSCYTITHIVQFTGLTDRTLRSYISEGILQGEKINGVWHFSPEQVEEFIRHPNVRPSILAKENAIVYDFMLEEKKSQCECCVILDLPGDDPEKVANYFCDTITHGPYHNIRFAFDGIRTPRVILRGHINEILALTNGYFV